jgi:cobyrinic acid a,c-diamide synthase
MYLSEGIETLDGRLHNLVGLLPARTRMLDRLKSLGYVETILAEDSLFGVKGSRLRGHEFHYSELLNDPTEGSAWNAIYRAKHRRSDAAVPEGYQNGRVLVSYVHMHFASRPEAVQHFIRVCSGVSG